MLLSKTDFLHYRACRNSLWLLKHKPEVYPHKYRSSYDEKLAQDGYYIQKAVADFLVQKGDGRKYFFNEKFKTAESLFAEADIISVNSDGTINLYEVKSTSSISNDHLVDATFQMVTIEQGGRNVNKIYLVHVNKNYVRNGELDVGEMMCFSSVTEQVRSLEVEVKNEINAALLFLKETDIDETSCSCLKLSRGHHCDSFDYFNANIPETSIYNLPRISKKKLETFVTEGRFDLQQIDESEVSGFQIDVLMAAKKNAPVINKEKIQNFFAQVNYPLYFLDYETFSSAVPIIDGVNPYTHIPFQFSIHIKENETVSETQHHQYLAENAELPINMITKLEEIIGSTGSIVVWHKTFENSRNKEMGEFYPEKAEFLGDMITRTIDLEDVFKGGYVDIAFGGSTSIKKVLPVLVPELSYQDLSVANGTDAMEAFVTMLDLEGEAERNNLRNEMLSYCKLDTLAMLKIFEVINKYA